MSRGLATALALGAGVLVAMQAPINSRLGRALGTFQAASFSFAVGLVVLVAIAAVANGGLGTVTRIGHQPWWYLIGGFLGAAYVASSLVTVRSLGAGGLTAATITGQLTMAVIIDQFGLLGVARHPVNAARLLGLVLLASGVFLVVRD
jgi:bacterial/archaeal transporter family-2 protein